MFSCSVVFVWANIVVGGFCVLCSMLSFLLTCFASSEATMHSSTRIIFLSVGLRLELLLVLQRQGWVLSFLVSASVVSLFVLCARTLRSAREGRKGEEVGIYLRVCWRGGRFS